MEKTPELVDRVLSKENLKQCQQAKTDINSTTLRIGMFL